MKRPRDEETALSLVVLLMIAVIGTWLWLYFAALLWDGLGGRWAQKSARGRNWLQTQRDRKNRTPKDWLAFAGGIVYHSIWLHPRISLGVSLVLLVLLSSLIFA
jgi:hypothetical protein